jgi:hypothetical protein
MSTVHQQPQLTSISKLQPYYHLPHRISSQSPHKPFHNPVNTKPKQPDPIIPNSQYHKNAFFGHISPKHNPYHTSYPTYMNTTNAISVLTYAICTSTSIYTSIPTHGRLSPKCRCEATMEEILGSNKCTLSSSQPQPQPRPDKQVQSHHTSSEN